MQKYCDVKKDKNSNNEKDKDDEGNRKLSKLGNRRKNSKKNGERNAIKRRKMIKSNKELIKVRKILMEEIGILKQKLK